MPSQTVAPRKGLLQLPYSTYTVPEIYSHMIHGVNDAANDIFGTKA
jgi:hypothetical protein